MSAVCYMFQSILNLFVFIAFLVEKINYYHEWGVPPPPFAENSTKIIKSIFEPFPKAKKNTLRHLIAQIDLFFNINNLVKLKIVAKTPYVFIQNILWLKAVFSRELG